MTDTQWSVTIDGAGVRTALRHGIELWWSNSTPTRRLDTRNDSSTFTRYVNNRIVGKLGELAFTEVLAGVFDVSAQVDWRVYGDYTQTDHGDCRVIYTNDHDEYKPAVEFDVKTTKPWNQWLAIRKQTYEQHPSDAPFILTMLSITDDIVLDEFESHDTIQDVLSDPLFQERWTDFVQQHLPVTVTIVGAVYPDEFTEYFDAGDRMYDRDSGNKIGGPLKMDNYAIHIDDIDNTAPRWDRVVSDIIGPHPITYNTISNG